MGEVPSSYPSQTMQEGIDAVVRVPPASACILLDNFKG